MDQPPFFPGDHPALRDGLCRYLAGLQDRLAACPWAGRVSLLLLAGGYGRGEGGVYLGGDTPALYNDLEFYLVLRSAAGGSDAPVRAWCAREAHRGEQETGIEVEFKVLTDAALRHAGPSMFYYDLLSANVPVFGNPARLHDLPAPMRDGAAVPAHEATRLLFNRGTGLLFCAEALRTGSPRVRDGFIERNHAKVRLALADAVLALNGRYHFSARERHHRLAEPLAHVPANWPQLTEWHRDAVEFKFHPRHEQPSADELLRRQQTLVAAWREVFLWLEAVRLGRPFTTATAYAAYSGRLFPASSLWRNLILHARDALRRKLTLSGWLDYPRAPLQKALALLLEPLSGTAAHLPSAALLLSLPAHTPRSRIEQKYRQGWQHYN